MTEVIRGLQRSQAINRLQSFLMAIRFEEVLPFDQTATELAGRISGDLERTGQRISLADPMIAAVAITNGLEMVTGNTRHFERIKQLGYSLTIVDWRI